MDRVLSTGFFPVRVVPSVECCSRCAGWRVHLVCDAYAKRNSRVGPSYHTSGSFVYEGESLSTLQNSFCSQNCVS